MNHTWLCLKHSNVTNYGVSCHYCVAERAERDVFEKVGVFPRAYADVRTRMQTEKVQPIELEGWLTALRQRCPHLFDDGITKGTTVQKTISVTFDLPDDNQVDLQLLVRDALHEFAGRRSPPRSYVAERYGYREKLWTEHDREQKIREVAARVDAALAVIGTDVVVNLAGDAHGQG